MDTKKDITTRIDIERLITEFYVLEKKDSIIGFIFTAVATINWEVHIPVIIDFFWGTILLDSPVYKKMQWKCTMS